MGEKLDSMEPQVREHLIQLVKTTDLPETEETLEMMAPWTKCRRKIRIIGERSSMPMGGMMRRNGAIIGSVRP